MSAASPLDTEKLIAAARLQTGLHDFGAPDVVEPLRRQINSFLGEARLSPTGLAMQEMNLMRLLINRLRLQKIVSDHPEIRDEEIHAPIVIVGLPRSGTTKLQRMMGADPALQTIPFWRMLSPIPGPDEAAGQPAPRIAIAEAATAYTKANFPEFQAGHPMSATDAEEEDFLMEHSFHTSLTYASHHMPGFTDWALKVDPKPYYDLLKLLMQFFQWEDRSSGKRWLIKATCHLHRLTWLFQSFPDATVVHCHRNPLSSLTSLADLFCTARGMCSDHVDRAGTGTFTLDYSRQQMQDYMDQRALLERDHLFVDVPFNDILANPFKVIEEVYRRAGIPMTEAARAAMQRWDQENPQHKHGQRNYTMESVGYTEARLREGMAHYTSRFAAYL